MKREERLTLTVAETATLLGIGRNQAYEAVRRGDIPAVRIGRRIVIPKAAIDRLLGSPPNAGVGAYTLSQLQ